MTAPNLWIAANQPAGPAVGFGLITAPYSRSGGSGAGGWQIVDRPRHGATTEWVDYGPFALTLNLIMDGIIGNASPVSLEPAIAVIESWEAPAAGTNPPLPPILTVTGPVAHTELPWVVQTLNWHGDDGDVIRDPATGNRTQQTLDIVLWQYLPPTVTVTSLSPATKANSGGTGITYTVRAGDTLPSIAAAQLGNWQLWTQIALLNGLRDPSALTAGQVLTLPAVSLPTTATPSSSPSASNPYVAVATGTGSYITNS